MDMTARGAFITAMAACCSARIAAMQEQNRIDRLAGRPATYPPASFEHVPDEFGLSRNAVLSYLLD